MKKELIHSKFIMLLIVFIIFLIVALINISCFKTDFCYRVLAKYGFMDYSISESRHRIEYRCLEGWYNTLLKMDVQADLVFYGNSITYESDFQRCFPKKRVLNLGCNRDDLDDMIHRAFIIKSVHPKKIFVLGGINRFMDITLKDFESKYKLLVDTISSQNPSATIFLQSILPVNPDLELGARYIDCLDKIKEANVIIKNIATNRKFIYVDLYNAYQNNGSLPRIFTRDGIHLKPDAYRIWATTIKQYVE